MLFLHLVVSLILPVFLFIHARVDAGLAPHLPHGQALGSYMVGSEYLVYPDTPTMWLDHSGRVHRKSCVRKVIYSSIAARNVHFGT